MRKRTSRSAEAPHSGIAPHAEREDYNPCRIIPGIRRGATPCRRRSSHPRPSGTRPRRSWVSPCLAASRVGSAGAVCCFTWYHRHRHAAGGAGYSSVLVPFLNPNTHRGLLPGRTVRGHRPAGRGLLERAGRRRAAGRRAARRRGAPRHPGRGGRAGRGGRVRPPAAAPAAAGVRASSLSPRHDRRAAAEGRGRRHRRTRSCPTSSASSASCPAARASSSRPTSAGSSSRAC